MQGILLGGILFLAVISLCKSQEWSDQSSNGFTIKTLFVPLRKGSTTIPIPDFSKIQPQLNSLNLPSLSISDLQQASTLSQNIRQKGNMIELSLQPLQDLRPKHGRPAFKSESPSQGQNFNNFYRNSNFQQQQQHNNGQYHSAENVMNHHTSPQHQFYQPESSYENRQHQNAMFQRNNTEFHYQSSDMPNENLEYQGTHHNLNSGRFPEFYNAMNSGQQVYVREGAMNHKSPPSDIVYTHSPQHQVHVYEKENSGNQDGSSHQNADSNFSGHYHHQMPSEINQKHQPYMGPSNERYLTSHHQISYDIPNNQHSEVINHSPFQGMHSQDTRHKTVNQQQPVNTYAVVHQRIPTNNFGGQGNSGNVLSEQGHFEQYKQATETRPATDTRHPPHEVYINNESTEYIRMSPNRDHIPMQMASQNHLKIENPQNSVENMQYPMKQYVSGNVNSYQYNSPPQVTQVQFMVPQDTSDRHHFQQLGSPIETELRNQNAKSNHPPATSSQGPYPDPTTETFFAENKQIYISPPSDYNSHNQKFHQRQPMNDQEYGKYSSQMEANTHRDQFPISIQAGQLGIHVAIPNKRHSNRESNNYNNAYA